MTFRGLARALAARLAPHTPPGLRIIERPRGYLRAPRRRGAVETLAVDEPELEEEIDLESYDPPYPAFAVLEALDFVQEFAVAELGEELSGEPWAELTATEIRFGYGAKSFQPIPLSLRGAISVRSRCRRSPRRNGVDRGRRP